MNVPIVQQPLPPRYMDVVGEGRHNVIQQPNEEDTVPRELTYLNTLNEVRVLQQLDQYEALFLKTIFERRNRYYITDENEKVFYFAKEVTDPLSRLCCNSRSMELHIRDDYGATLMILHRPLRCGTGMWWCCCLQKIEVEHPRGITQAYVKERWTLWWPAADIVNPEGEVLYRIRGSCCSTKYRCHNSLQVFKGKSGTRVASYHKYLKNCTECFASINDFTLKYDGPLSAEDKLLLLGAGFVVDLLFLEHRTF